MKKNNHFSPEMQRTPRLLYKSNPLKRIAIVRGVMKTQILPKICCQILHLCISYSNKTGFSHWTMVKLKCQQFPTMVWPTLELIAFDYTHLISFPKFITVSYQYISTTMYLVTLLRWVDCHFFASPHKTGTQLKKNSTKASKLKWRKTGW